jgi:hypothetical protein
LGVPAHERDVVIWPGAAGRQLYDPLHASSGGGLYERAFHQRLSRVVPRHEERAVHAIQRLRQGLGSLEVCDDRIHTASGEAVGALLGPHHRARLGPTPDELLDERATNLAAGPGDEDGAQDPNTLFHHDLCTPS